MKEVTLKIPDSKYKFFMELVKNLGFDNDDELAVSEEQKAIVRERTLKSQENPERLLDWEDIKDDFRLD